MSQETERVRREEVLPVPLLVVIDFDRTLADSNACLERFYNVAGPIADTTAIKDQDRHARELGQSFDPLEAFYATITEDQRTEFEQKFIAEKEPPLLYEDSLPFLHRLNASELPFIVLTKAVNTDWQKLKIKASGYPGEAIIVDHDGKSAEINNWRNDQNNRYEVVINKKRIGASSIILIDDKKAAFDGLSSGNSGFFIQRGKTQITNLSSNVPGISSFDDLIVSRRGITKKIPAQIRRG